MEMMAWTGGPMKTIPSVASCAANLEFSLRKPYLHTSEVFQYGACTDDVAITYPGCTA